MNILSVGNSFSHDAQQYLKKIAEADGCELTTFNLYIGGCSLSQHYRNMLSKQRVYTLEMNGENTGFEVSLEEALLNRDWDVVTFQQASRQSNDYGSFCPYLNTLAEYVKKCVPHAKIAIHQTWAYEEGSTLLTEDMGYEKQEDMFHDIEKAYNKAFEETGADLLIPSGKLFQKMISEGIDKIHRDTLHASLGIGRYALGLLWYSVLTGNDIKNNSFAKFDEEISDNHIEIIKKCVAECTAAL